jgi:hypothetical protein
MHPVKMKLVDINRAVLDDPSFCFRGSDRYPAAETVKYVSGR